jgi:hypothetical protein
MDENVSRTEVMMIDVIFYFPVKELKRDFKV